VAKHVAQYADLDFLDVRHQPTCVDGHARAVSLKPRHCLEHKKNKYGVQHCPDVEYARNIQKYVYYL
jgi:hypothetical protein